MLRRAALSLGATPGQMFRLITIEAALPDAVADSLLAAKQIPKAPRASTYAVPALMAKARPDWVTVK